MFFLFSFQDGLLILRLLQKISHKEHNDVHEHLFISSHVIVVKNNWSQPLDILFIVAFLRSVSADKRKVLWIDWNKWHNTVMHTPGSLDN